MRQLFLIPLVFCAFAALPAAAAAAPAKATAPAASANAFSRNPALPKWVEALEPVPATKSEEPVVIRLAEAQYWTGANPAYLVNRAVQVNSSSRLSELGQFSIPFIPAYQKLVVHRIAIMRGNQVFDRTMSANVRVLDSETDAEQGYYFGAATAKILLEDVKAGDTLWMTYTVEGSNPVFGATWSEHLPWTKESPIELRKVVVLHPLNKPVQWRLSGPARASLATPIIDQRNGIGRLVFLENAVGAEEFEPSIPPDFIPMPIVDLSQYKDWSQVAQWANALFSKTNASPEVLALARTFVAGTLEQRASQALHWVQDDIRYFSVSMGENSHRPQAPEVVLKRRFGDCKDKSQLLVALYRAMGLQAQPVLLHATAPRLPAQLLPSPGSFNHAIVRVIIDGKPYFVDPTRQDERGLIASLAVPVPGAAALIVSAETSELSTLPDDVSGAPLVERDERLTIPTLHGSGKLQLHKQYNGRFAAGMRQMYRSMSSNDLKKMLLEQYERTYPGIELDGAPKLNDAAGGAAFVVDAQFTIPAVLKEDETGFYLAQRSHIMEGTLGMPDKLVRKHPFYLSAGRYRAHYRLDVSLPAEARLTKEDDHIAVDTKFFQARALLTWRGAHLNYDLDYAITEPQVEAAALPALSDDVKKLEPLFEAKLRFKPVDVAPQAAKEASLRVLDIMQKENQHLAMQREAVSTGKIPELKFEESEYAKLNYRALCESVIDGVSVLDWNPYLAAPTYALYKIVEAHADQRTKDVCMARRLLTEHDVAGASKALAKLALPDTDPLTLMQAWADFHAGDLVQARANLARFLKAKTRAGSLHTSDAVLALALARRLGMDEPEQVSKLVATLPADAWPSPLFGLLRGLVSEPDLMAKIEQLPPAAREYATMEAHFFISQAYLAAHARDQAVPHLNWFSRFGMLGDRFEILADADQYAEARADPDMREVWRLQREKGDEGAIVQVQRAAADKGIALAQHAMGWRYLKGQATRADPGKAMAMLEAAAAKGDSGATNDLGVVYAGGLGVKQDDARAMRYFRQAAEQGNATAAYNLGRNYWFGEHGVAVDFDLAFRHMRDGAELGEAEAQFFLSRLYFEGKGTEKNDTLAMFWAAQSHFRKSKDGSAQLGLMLIQLETDSAARQYGLELLARAASQFNGFAQFEYARMLLDGIGVQADPDAAYKIANTSLILGNNDRSTALVGRMYMEGVGVSADVAKGLALLRKLEAKGVPEAFYQLGRVYRGSKAGMTDKAKAAEYFRRAAAVGQLEAAEALAVMLHTGEGIPSNLPEAARFYGMAVKAGYPRAMNNLADMIERGNGVAQDLDQAMGLYRRSAQMGHTSAMLNLAEIYETHPKAKKEAFLPLAYYMLASKLGVQEADDALKRLKSASDAAIVEKAQKYAASWKPGNAMPEES